MQYMGGKTRVARHIETQILAHKGEATSYLEPFMGSAAVTAKAARHFVHVEAGDAMPDLVLMWQALQGGWVPPDVVSPEEYRDLRNAEPSALRGFVGFGCSFGGKWFAGYAKNARGDDFAGAAKRGVMKKAGEISGAVLKVADYRDWNPGPDTVVYCDPPYAGTTGYAGPGAFDHGEFWSTVHGWACGGSTVLVSEYEAPAFAAPVWEREVKVSLKKDDNLRAATEKLFLVKP